MITITKNDIYFVVSIVRPFLEDGMQYIRDNYIATIIFIYVSILIYLVQSYKNIFNRLEIEYKFLFNKMMLGEQDLSRCETKMFDIKEILTDDSKYYYTGYSDIEELSMNTLKSKASELGIPDVNWGSKKALLYALGMTKKLHEISKITCSTCPNYALKEEYETESDEEYNSDEEKNDSSSEEEYESNEYGDYTSSSEEEYDSDYDEENYYQECKNDE